MWPDEELPDFRPAFQELGRLIVRVGLLLARQCDRYAASRLPEFSEGRALNKAREACGKMTKLASKCHRSYLYARGEHKNAVMSNLLNDTEEADGHSIVNNKALALSTFGSSRCMVQNK